MTRVISKDNCIFCTRAKALLDMKDEEYTELKIDVDVSREQFAEMTGNAMSFPQVFLTIDGTEVLIGGYDKLVEYYNRA